MITTVQEAVHPILIVCSVFGLGIYSPKKRSLNILYKLTLWTSYGYLYYYAVTSLNAEVWFQSITNIVHIRIGALTTLTSIIMSIYQDKKFILFMKRLAAVDDTLEELGTPKICQKLHAYAKRVLIGWLVCINIANACDMTWWFYAMENHWCMILPYITNHFHHMNMLTDLLLMTYLWYIGNRFDRVNEYITYLIVKEENGLRYFWRETTPNTHRYIMYTDHKRVLWTSMHLHLELCHIARELNTIFGPQMAMEMAAYLVYIARLCDYIFQHIQTKGRYVRSSFAWFAMSFWIFIHLARLFSLNYICEKISAKANEIKRIIHELTNSLRYADVHNEIYQFSLQVIHHPLKFTGMGLFYFGNNLLRKFATTITTFMIIIIQMSVTPKREIDF